MDLPGTSRDRTSVLQRVGLLLVFAAIIVPALTLRLSVYPAPWIDEGYRTHAARLLVERGRYGTETTNGFIPFDPSLSSGPLDVAAIGLSTKLFGRSIGAARLAVVCFGLIAIAALLQLATDVYGWAAGFLISLFVIAAPPAAAISFILINRQTIGEGPALAMLVLGSWLLLRSRRNDSLALSIAAGIAVGTVFFCKVQVGVSAVAALGLQHTVEWWRGSPSRRSAVPLAVAVGVIVSWLALQWWATPAAARAENLAALQELARANVLTDVHGRELSTSAKFMLAIIATATVATCARYRTRGAMPDPAAASTELFLALFCAMDASWITLLTLGWPRYLFVPFMISLYLLAAAQWDAVRRRLPSTRARPWATVMFTLTAGILIAIAFIAHILPIIRFTDTHRTAEAAAFIDRTIAPEAVVESWEWELDGLTDHWRFHHPSQQYFTRAIWQFGHGQPFALSYDALSGNPDYLIAGTFSDWTRLYDANVITANFDHIEDIGTYRVYRRRR